MVGFGYDSETDEPEERSRLDTIDVILILSSGDVAREELGKVVGVVLPVDGDRLARGLVVVVGRSIVGRVVVTLVRCRLGGVLLDKGLVAEVGVLAEGLARRREREEERDGTQEGTSGIERGIRKGRA
jgi:hypothetical protein